MKRILLLMAFLAFLWGCEQEPQMPAAGMGGAGMGGAQVDVVRDAAYGVGWNGDTTHAPSRNAVYDQFVVVAATVEDDAYGAGWNADTTHAPSQNAVYDILHAYDTDDDGDIDTLNSAALNSIDGLTETNGGIPYGTADNAYAWLAAGAQGTLLMGNGAAAPSWLAAGAANYVLLGAGASDPVWTAEAGFKSALNLEAGTDYNAYSATLASLAGLTETNGGIAYGTADNAYAWLAAGAQGTLLMGNGAAAPSWLAAGTAGYFLIANGAADPVWTQQPSLASIEGLTLTAGDIIYASAADTFAVLDHGETTEILVGGGAAAPVWTACQGTGAPVRATSPTLTTPNIGTADVTLLDYADTNDPAPAAEGERAWDANADAMESHTGSVSRLTPTLYQKEMTIFEPDQVNDQIPFFEVNAKIYPHGITLVSLSIQIPADAAYTMTFEEWDGDPPAAQNDSEAVSTGAADNYMEVEDASIDDQVLDADDWLFLDIPATDVDWITCSAVFYVTTGN